MAVIHEIVYDGGSIGDIKPSSFDEDISKVFTSATDIPLIGLIFGICLFPLIIIGALLMPNDEVEG